MYGAGRTLARALVRRPGRTFQRYQSSDYAEKIRQKTLQTGLSAEELRKQALEKLQKEEREAAASLPVFQKRAEQEKTGDATKADRAAQARKDNSPVKPLSDILRLSKIATATKEQVGALWTAYHASRSGGTGRGYICAAVPIDLYTKMSTVGAKYPCFVLPLSRPDAEDPAKINHEFFFMEWGFHHSPPVPSADEDPFAAALSQKTQTTSPNPKVSTILFTPLQEYKMRNSFATPYMIMTHHTDLVESHGIVLLRGEITPVTGAGSSPDGKFMLSQADAQLLALGLQKFYLWGEKDGEVEGERLLTLFHNKPDEFDWEELLNFHNRTAI